MGTFFVKRKRLLMRIGIDIDNTITDKIKKAME